MQLFIRLLLGLAFTLCLAAADSAPSAHWPLATLLIGGVSVLLLLGIKERVRCHSTNGSAATTTEVGKSAPPQDKL
jgi:hypothetical protein